MWDVVITAGVTTVPRATTWVVRVSVLLGGEVSPVIVRVHGDTTASNVDRPVTAVHAISVTRSADCVCVRPASADRTVRTPVHQAHGDMTAIR